MAKHEWRRGGSVKSIGDILRRMTSEDRRAPAARSGDGSTQRVRAYLSMPGRVERLVELDPFTAVDRLMVVAGFNDKSRNDRVRWSRLLAQRLGRHAAAAVAGILADVVADGTALSVGGCLRHRLRQIAQGRPEDGLSGRAPQELRVLLRKAFSGDQA